MRLGIGIGLSYPRGGVGGTPAPVNTIAPAVTGTGTIGEVLTSTTGTWTNSPTSYAYQWRRNGVDIAGATASTYTLVSADGGTSVLCRVTATNTGGSAGANSNAVAVGAASPGLAPFFDDFTGNGAMTARPNWTTTSATNQAAFINQFTTSGGNLTRGATATAGVHTVHDSGAGAGASRGWAKEVEAASTLGAASFMAHVTIIPANNAGASITAIQMGNQLATTHSQQAVVAGTVVAPTNVNVTHLPTAGSVYELRTVNDAGTMRSQIFVNGRRFSMTTGANVTELGIDIAATLGGAPNGKYGFNMGVSAPCARMFGTQNMATEAGITVVSVGPVRQAGKPVYLFGEYFGARAPTSAEVTVTCYNPADDTVISGFNGIGLTGFVAANGVWAATIVNPGVSFWADVRWTFADTLGATVVASYPTSTQIVGDVIVVEGQSQVEFLTSSAGDTAPAPTPYTVAFLAWSSVPASRRGIQGPVAANSNLAALANAAQAVVTRPLTIITAAKGGTPYRGATDALSRAKPSPQYDATLEGIKAVAGGRPGAIVISGGTSTETGTIYDNILQYANDLDADLGFANTFIVFPEGNTVQAGSGTPSSYRRQMWKLCNDFPTRFKLGGWRNELQHQVGGTTVDPLHYAAASSTGFVSGQTQGDADYGKRIGDAKALHLDAGPDYRGPRVNAAPVKTSATTLRVSVDLGSFDAVEAVNTAYLNDFTGGFEFNDATTFVGTVYTPTAAPTIIVTGSTATIEWTFASLPATVYVRAAMGDNPFNRTNVANVNLVMYDRASVIRGTKSGQPPRAIWPTYNWGGSGVDYGTAS